MDNYAGAKLSVFSMLLDYHREDDHKPDAGELGAKAASIVEDWVKEPASSGDVVSFEVH